MSEFCFCSLVSGSLLTLNSIRYYLSDRFRLRMEDSGLDQLTEEVGEEGDDGGQSSKDVFDEDAIYDKYDKHASDMEQLVEGGVIRTLDGEVAGDEFAQDAMNYQILLGKIDHLLENLRLDA